MIFLQMYCNMTYEAAILIEIVWLAIKTHKSINKPYEI